MKKNNGKKSPPKDKNGGGIKSVIGRKTADKGYPTSKACKSGRFYHIKSIATGHPKGRTILVPKNLLTSSDNDTAGEEEKRLD